VARTPSPAAGPLPIPYTGDTASSAKNEKQSFFYSTEEKNKRELYIVLFIQFHAMRSYLPIFTLILIFAGACIHWSCESNSSSPSETSKIDKASQKNTSIADIEREIRRHIAEVTEEDGYFTLDTDTQNLQLQLVRVHTEYLSVLDTNEFFACVDLATTSGDVYDVDFFLRGTSDNMSVTQTDLHKLNGKPFYSWKQKEDGRWTQVPTAGASSELLGVIEGEDHFQFTYTVVLPEWDGKASMWLPLASSDSFQTIDLQSIKGPKLNWEQRRDSAWNNKYMYASFDDQYVGDTIRIEYEVLRREKSAYPAKEDILAPYLGATPFLPIGGRFESLARKITDSRSAQTPLSQARALYDYISDSLRYAKEGTYGTADAQYACDAMSGNCTEFHSLFISLARSLGIPARFAVGAAIPSERDEGGVDGYHCWAEFYADGKWWPVDISEANKYSALATYYFGHHPANRIELSLGRQIPLSPSPNEGPVTFFAYPIFEVEGKKMYPVTLFSFERKI